MLDLIKDLWGFMRERKKFWLAPIIIVMQEVLARAHHHRHATARRADCARAGLRGGALYLYAVLTARLASPARATALGTTDPRSPSVARHNPARPRQWMLNRIRREQSLGG